MKHNRMVVVSQYISMVSAVSVPLAPSELLVILSSPDWPESRILQVLFAGN
jgi:hypothetical protein